MVNAKNNCTTKICSYGQSKIRADFSSSNSQVKMAVQSARHQTLTVTKMIIELHATLTPNQLKPRIKPTTETSYALPKFRRMDNVKNNSRIIYLGVRSVRYFTPIVVSRQSSIWKHKPSEIIRVVNWLIFSDLSDRRNATISLRWNNYSSPKRL
jgi:hypothetical protein